MSCFAITRAMKPRICAKSTTSKGVSKPIWLDLCDATPGPVVSPDHGELLHTEACVSRSKRHSWDAFRDSHRKAKLSWPSSTHVGKGTLGAPDWSPKPLPRPSRAEALAQGEP